MYCDLSYMNSADLKLWLTLKIKRVRGVYRASGGIACLRSQNPYSNKTDWIEITWEA